MNHLYRPFLTILILSTFWLASCQTTPDPADPTPATALETATPVTTGAAVNSTPNPIGAQTEITLTVWIPISLIPNLAVLERSGWQEQLEAFDESHPNLSLHVELKTLAGQGGILNYLRSGREIAPAVLPDLIVIPTTHLPQAINDKLVYNMNQLIGADLIADLYPAPASIVQPESAIMGYPFAITQMPHLASSKILTGNSSITTWDAFINRDETLALTLNSTEAGQIGLQFYLANGGTLLNQNNQLMLDELILTESLTQLRLARNRGVLVSQSLGFSSHQDAWRFFQRGSVDWVQTTANQFLQERALGFTGSYTSFPGPDGPLPPLVNSWSWAISTPDPAHQAATMELISWLAAEQNIGFWSQQMQLLPARRAALTYWPENDPYTSFLNEQMERAIPFPAAAEGVVLDLLTAAVIDVISFAEQPQEAAQNVVNQINPK